MTLYNGSDVSKMLNVNEETVRRWIRDGKIKAQRALGRVGNTMFLDDIVNFVNKTPRAYLVSFENWLIDNHIEYERIYDNEQNQGSSTVISPALAGVMAGVAASTPLAAPIVMGTGFCASKVIKKKNYQHYIIKITNTFDENPVKIEEPKAKTKETSDNSFTDTLPDSYPKRDEDFFEIEPHLNTDKLPTNDLDYNGILDAIARAKRLLDEDIISREEFDTIKSKLIAKL